MIITQLRGGLGNQLFEYAFALRLAHERGTTFKVDARKVLDDPLRTYRLPYLRVQAEQAQPSDFSWFSDPSRRYHWWRTFTNRFLPQRSYHIMDEAELFRHDPTIARQAGHLYLRGWWQQEAYFAPVADLIRQQFVPLAMPDNENQRIAAHMQQVNSVCVHIRRGDYVADAHTRSVHGVLDARYYADALRWLAAQVPDMHLFIFSDDPAWCRTHLTFDHPMTIMEHNGSEQDYLDLWLMSHCKHFVIANSSFSWWGAWLGRKQPSSLVVAPTYWLQQPLIPGQQVVAAGWHVLASS